MRAMLIVSVQPMSGSGAGDQYGISQGFGYPSVANALPLNEDAGVQASPTKLYVKNYQKILFGQTETMNIQVGQCRLGGTEEVSDNEEPQESQ